MGHLRENTSKEIKGTKKTHASVIRERSTGLCRPRTRWEEKVTFRVRKFSKNKDTGQREGTIRYCLREGKATGDLHQSSGLVKSKSVGGKRRLSTSIWGSEETF